MYTHTTIYTDTHYHINRHTTSTLPYTHTTHHTHTLHTETHTQRGAGKYQGKWIYVMLISSSSSITCVNAVFPIAHGHCITLIIVNQAVYLASIFSRGIYNTCYQNTNYIHNVQCSSWKSTILQPMWALRYITIQHQTDTARDPPIMLA